MSATILVVDDNEANRALARDTLETEGYRAVVATGGAEGIAAFERERPDCVVLDVRMPDMDGFAVCQRIRSLPRGADTPVLFLTALRDVDTFDKALLAGGDDFLTKPVRPAELVVRVQTALELHRMSAELREHYDLLKQQRDELLRVQLQKERITAFVVHDLKNPVNAMDLHAQVLLRDAGLSATARTSATNIRAEARKLGRMIQNLLDISKADEGQLEPKLTEVDLGQLVGAVLGELEVTARAHEVTLRSSVGLSRVRADEELLRRTITNLVENAIRHAPSGTEVVVSGAARDGEADLRVRDAGRGVPAELREKIFDPFVQLAGGDASRSHGGRGLGLTFCRVAIEAHGGRIWVEDGAPGAVFCVTLPHAV
jgi:signal transduction histidine kinase